MMPWEEGRSLNLQFTALGQLGECRPNGTSNVTDVRLSASVGSCEPR